MMEKKEFYAECDRILGQDHPEPKVYARRGRWGPREPGSGRYEGYGLIRWFSSSMVIVSLREPIKIQKNMSPEDAIILLNGIVMGDVHV